MKLDTRRSRNIDCIGLDQVNIAHCKQSRNAYDDFEVHFATCKSADVVAMIFEDTMTLV